MALHCFSKAFHQETFIVDCLIPKGSTVNCLISTTNKQIRVLHPDKDISALASQCSFFPLAHVAYFYCTKASRDCSSYFTALTHKNIYIIMKCCRPVNLSLVTSKCLVKCSSLLCALNSHVLFFRWNHLESTGC